MPLLLHPAAALAGTIDLAVTRPLEFGAFVVLGSGAKEIGPDGAVTTSGIAGVSGSREGPAEVTLRYTPSGSARNALVMVSMTTVNPQSSNGSTGTLAGFTTDLPGASQMGLGQSRVISLPRCTAPACTTVFRVGGRLQISGGSASASFGFPLQVTVRLLSETP